MPKEKKIAFYLDTTVAGYEKTKAIVEDYLYWFKGDKQTELVLFSSSGHTKALREYLSTTGLRKRQGILFFEKAIPPEKLHKFYKKRLLLNEWVHYKKGDIFRLYKLFYPLNRETNFDNQPISIQYDIRYHEHRTDEYKGYAQEQISHIASAMDYYNPKRILDAGCGSGAQFFYLQDKIKQHNCQYVGIDNSRFQIIKAIDLFEDKKTTFQLSDITQLEFEDNAFDLGFTESTLMFCENPLKALKELERVCKHGFFASLYTIKNNPEQLKPIKKGPIYYLDTGATWKYYDKITPNVYKIPDYHHTKKTVEAFQNVVMIQNNVDQFFEPLGISTTNVFFFPRQWYHPSKLVNFTYHPLM